MAQWVKDLALSFLWLWLQLWRKLDPWPGELLHVVGMVKKKKEKEKKAKVKDGLFSGISSLLLIFCEVHRGCAMGGLCSKERELGTWATSLFLMS